MWNPEARDSSPIIFFYIYEFVFSGSCARSRREGGGVKEWENPLRGRISLFTQWMMPKKPPPPGRRRTRGNGAGKSTAVEDFVPYSVEAVQEAAGKEEE